MKEIPCLLREKTNQTKISKYTENIVRLLIKLFLNVFKFYVDSSIQEGKKICIFFPNSCFSFCLSVPTRMLIDVIRKCLPKGLICIQDSVRDWNKDYVHFDARKHRFCQRGWIKVHIKWCVTHIWHMTAKDCKIVQLSHPRNNPKK